MEYNRCCVRAISMRARLIKYGTASACSTHRIVSTIAHVVTARTLSPMYSPLSAPIVRIRDAVMIRSGVTLLLIITTCVPTSAPHRPIHYGDARAVRDGSARSANTMHRYVYTTDYSAAVTVHACWRTRRRIIRHRTVCVIRYHTPAHTASDKNVRRASWQSVTASALITY